MKIKYGVLITGLGGAFVAVSQVPGLPEVVVTWTTALGVFIGAVGGAITAARIGQKVKQSKGEKER